MSIVNFSVPQTLERRIATIVKKKGFSSKAELFRFAVIRYMDENEGTLFENDSEIAELTQKLEQVMTKNLKGKKLPSIAEQLKRAKSL